MLAIEAHDLVRAYAPGRGVCGVSLAVEPGECLALLGRNGSGKTTLLRLVLGLERPRSGRLRVLGADVAAGSRSHLAGTGAATDRAAQWDALSGRACAMFVARSYGMDAAAARAAVDAWLARADLAAQADEPVSAYSFGMRRKLALVQALVHEPALAVLDEPTAGVDAHFAAVLAGEIARRCRTGRTTLVATNDPDWAAGVVSRVALMDAGRIVRCDAPAALVAELGGRQEIRITLAAPAALASDADAAVPPTGAETLHLDGTIVTAIGPDDPHLPGRLVEWVAQRGGAVRTMEVRRPTLRDAFLVATGKAIDA
jgi:ABC-2 type transport system ATP-binding protein